MSQDFLGKSFASAFIELEGPLLEARLTCSDTTNDMQYYARHEGLLWEVFPDTQLTAVVVGETTVAARCEAREAEELHGLTIWILFLGTREDEGQSWVDAIALRELQPNGEAFERIGLMHEEGHGLGSFEGEDERQQEAHLVWQNLIQKAEWSRVKIF